MGRSAGAGSPVFFRCLKERDTLSFGNERHSVALTGRSRPYHRKRGSVKGSRSTSVAREYTCETCGYVGWSNHVDLAELAGEGRRDR